MVKTSLNFGPGAGRVCWSVLALKIPRAHLCLSSLFLSIIHQLTLASRLSAPRFTFLTPLCSHHSLWDLPPSYTLIYNKPLSLHQPSPFALHLDTINMRFSVAVALVATAGYAAAQTSSAAAPSSTASSGGCDAQKCVSSSQPG